MSDRESIIGFEGCPTCVKRYPESTPATACESDTIHMIAMASEILAHSAEKGHVSFEPEKPRTDYSWFAVVRSMFILMLIASNLLA